MDTYKIKKAIDSLDSAIAAGMDPKVFTRAYISWSRADKDLLADPMAEHAGFAWDADDLRRLGR